MLDVPLRQRDATVAALWVEHVADASCEIVADVGSFAGGEEPHDDQTLVLLAID